MSHSQLFSRARKNFLKFIFGPKIPLKIACPKRGAREAKFANLQKLQILAPAYGKRQNRKILQNFCNFAKIAKKPRRGLDQKCKIFAKIAKFDTTAVAECKIAKFCQKFVQGLGFLPQTLR